MILEVKKPSICLEEAIDAFFGPELDNAIGTMVNDWKTDEQDESTELALLDIMSFLAVSASNDVHFIFSLHVNVESVSTVWRRLPL